MNKHFIIFACAAMFSVNKLVSTEVEKQSTPVNIAQYLQQLAAMSAAEKQALEENPARIQEIETLLTQHQDTVMAFVEAHWANRERANS